LRDFVFEKLKSSVENSIRLVTKLRKQGDDFMDITYDESGLYISEEEIVRRRWNKLATKLLDEIVEELNKEFATSYRLIKEEPSEYLFKVEFELKKGDDKRRKYLFEILYKNDIEILLDEVKNEE
jgi:hypothetical protein